MYLQVFLKTTKYKTNKWITTCTDLINFYLSTYLFWLSSLKRKQKCQFQVYRIIGCRKIEVWCQTGQNGQHDYIFHLRELEIGGLFLFLFPIFSYQVSLLMTFSGSFNNSLPNILRLGGRGGTMGYKMADIDSLYSQHVILLSFSNFWDVFGRDVDNN